MSALHEVTIRVEDAFIDPWGIGIGDPSDRPLPPTLIFIAADVHLALRQGFTVWPSRSTLEVSPAGFATVTVPGYPAALYELFPAKFDDDEPYTPIVYIGRWPD